MRSWPVLRRCSTLQAYTQSSMIGTSCHGETSTHPMTKGEAIAAKASQSDPLILRTGLVATFVEIMRRNRRALLGCHDFDVPLDFRFRRSISAHATFSSSLLQPVSSAHLTGHACGAV